MRYLALQYDLLAASELALSDQRAIIRRLTGITFNDAYEVRMILEHLGTDNYLNTLMAYPELYQTYYVDSGRLGWFEQFTLEIHQCVLGYMSDELANSNTYLADYSVFHWPRIFHRTHWAFLFSRHQELVKGETLKQRAYNIIKLVMVYIPANYLLTDEFIREILKVYEKYEDRLNERYRPKRSVRTENLE